MQSDQDALIGSIHFFDSQRISYPNGDIPLRLGETGAELDNSAVMFERDETASIAKRRDRFRFAHDQSLDRGAGLALKLKHQVPERAHGEILYSPGGNQRQKAGQERG